MNRKFGNYRRRLAYATRPARMGRRALQKPSGQRSTARATPEPTPPADHTRGQPALPVRGGAVEGELALASTHDGRTRCRGRVGGPVPRLGSGQGVWRRLALVERETSSAITATSARAAAFKEANPAARCYLVEPECAAALSGEPVTSPSHRIQGGGYAPRRRARAWAAHAHLRLSAHAGVAAAWHQSPPRSACEILA